ncbi:MAG: restriction endonuclease [Pseudomonadota bacterium]
MMIPDFQSLMLPLLRIAATGEVHILNAVTKIIKEFNLSSADSDVLLPSGKQTYLHNRVTWAITYLAKAGLIKRPRLSYFTITDEGQAILNQKVEKIDSSDLMQYKGFRDFYRPDQERRKLYDYAYEFADGRTPEEHIEGSFEHLNEKLRSELIERVLQMSPSAFERLVIDLLVSMGYGGAEDARQVGGVRDGGIDGIIKVDVLGLDLIYLQAKRYTTDKKVGVEKIREFAGALDVRGIQKGVFVTTSSFSELALRYAHNSPKQFIMIDGAELASMLVQYDIGVRAYRTLELKKIDSDYFDGIN